MSQEKVNRYKEEKKNREKNMKKAKAKKVVITLFVSLCIGALLGIPLGRGIYKYQKDQKALNATIDPHQFDEWVKSYYTEKYFDLYESVEPETEAFEAEDYIEEEPVGSAEENPDDSVTVEE